MQNQPLLIIALGPTGSGKGSIEKKIKQLYGLQDTVQFVPILIDDLIEENAKYKDKIKLYLDDVKKQYSSIITNDELANYITGTGVDEAISKFNDAYFSTRKGKNCSINKTQITCDSMNDEKLNEAIIAGNNVIFET